MRYWFDTEFIDNKSTIDLISIGIVSQKGKEYYAVSNEFNYSAADEWVRQHVYPSLPDKSEWKPRSVIRKEIVAFLNKRPEFWVYNGAYDWVAFCQLFGSIQDLPKGYPWYANDIKQYWHMLKHPKLPSQDESAKHDALEDARWNRRAWEFLQEYELKENNNI